MQRVSADSSRHSSLLVSTRRKNPFSKAKTLSVVCFHTALKSVYELCSTDLRLALIRSQQTIFAEWTDDYPYQKLTALSSEPGKQSRYVAVGTTDNKVAILTFPGLAPIGLPVQVEGGDLVDVQWGGPDGSWLAVASSSTLNIYEFSHEGLEKHVMRVLQSIPAPTIDGGLVQFRAARFAPHSEQPDLLVAFNAAQPSRREKRRARRAYLGRYGAIVARGEKSETVLVKEGEVAEISEKETSVESVTWELVAKREVAGKPITVLDVSADGKLVSFGSSDLSIGMLDARTLAVRQVLKELTLATTQDPQCTFLPTNRLEVQPVSNYAGIC